MTGKQAVPDMPDVSTMAEAGVPSFEHTNRYGIFTPAGTPKAIIARLNEAVVKALDTAELHEKLVQRGLKPQSSTPEELGKILHADTAKGARSPGPLGYAFSKQLTHSLYPES